MSTNPPIWALLVGINAYASPGINTLNGCENDVEAMRIFLLNQMHVPETQIKVLTNQAATRAAILDAFKTHLIENPQIQRGDQLLFHYSGHGSYMPSNDPNEPDGLDETVVAHDSRMPGIFDIPDKTLAALLDQLAAAKSDPAAPGDNITVILDSCHSGSGTRSPEDHTKALTRTAPPDIRIPPATLDADLQRGAATRSIKPTQSGWAITHLLLAGCLDREESYEHTTPEGTHHGALTYFTLDYLKNPPPNATYGDLYARVKPQVSKLYPKQTPQCEGNRQRALFGGAIIESDPFIPVLAEGGGVKLEAGLVHGVREGAELAIYPAEIKTRAVAVTTTPLATVTVQSVSATTAQAVFATPPGAELPIDAHALVTKQAYAGIQQRVFLVSAPDAQGQQALDSLRAAILSAGGKDTDGKDKPSPYLALVDDLIQPIDLRVVADKGSLIIQNQEGEILVLPADYQSAATATTTSQALESIARYRSLQALTNEGQSELRDKVKLGLYRWSAGQAEDVDLAQQTLEEGKPLILSYYPDDRERNKYLIKVTNNSNLKVYAHLFYLGPDFSIARLYPGLGQQELLEPGRTLPCPLLGSGYSFEMYLPGDSPGEQKWDISHDAVKLIVTTQPANLELLNQPALNVPPAKGTRGAGSPLDQLLNASTGGSTTTRHQRPVTPAVGEDWTTADLSFNIERTAMTQTLDAARNDNIQLSDGIILEKPAGFVGAIRVSTLPQAQSTRGEGPAIKLPPLLAMQPALFQPLTRRQTRGTEGEPLVLTLTTDEGSRQSITTANPLRLRVPTAASDDVMPVAFDGEDFLPVGYSAQGVVHIVNLPPGHAATAVASDQPTTRGAWHALQLFLIKKSGRYSDRIGLRYAEFHPDTTEPSHTVQYSQVQKERFKAGDSVALFVHGFTADTAEIVQSIVPFLRNHVQNYTHLLTYDYETFNTGIEQNGETLALALRQRCGFHADDGITLHVFAHSMGTLVTRCMVELFDGHQWIDRVVLAGPPNNGTALASLSRGFTYLLTAMLNGLSNIPLVGAVPWLVQEFYDQGIGWEDLKTDSTIVRRLNGLQAPDEVPYLVLAGNNEGNPAQGNRLTRLAHKLFDRSLDSIFGEPEHDTVIGMSSMKSLRGGAYPKATLKTLPCNHFGYFATPEAQAAIREWFRG